MLNGFAWLKMFKLVILAKSRGLFATFVSEKPFAGKVSLFTMQAINKTGISFCGFFVFSA